MKKLFNTFLVMIIVCASACSKQDDTGSDSLVVATLSLDAVFNDIAASSGDVNYILNKKPSCLDSSPAYVAVVLSGTKSIGSLNKPFIIPVDPARKGNSKMGKLRGGDGTELELEPGTYSLDYFVVYDGDPAKKETNLLWIAPTKESEFSSYVEGPLPLKIDLGAGTKKNLKVDVLCANPVSDEILTDFALSPVELIDVCFFINYCSPAGRHYSANYTLNLWLGDSNEGELLYSNESPETGLNEDGDFYADPLCLKVPVPLDEANNVENYLYYEVALDSWEENYGTVESVIISGELTLEDIKENISEQGKIDYLHLNFSCDADD